MHFPGFIFYNPGNVPFSLILDLILVFYSCSKSTLKIHSSKECLYNLSKIYRSGKGEIAGAGGFTADRNLRPTIQW